MTMTDKELHAVSKYAGQLAHTEKAEGEIGSHTQATGLFDTDRKRAL